MRYVDAFASLRDILHGEEAGVDARREGAAVGEAEGNHLGERHPSHYLKNRAPLPAPGSDRKATEEGCPVSQGRPVYRPLRRSAPVHADMVVSR